MATELFDLELVRLVVRLGSISKAAISLHMSQPSLSQRIISLEEELGQPLFERHRRGVHPTAAGNQFVQYANRALALIEEGVDVVKAMSAPKLRLKIAGPPSINSHIVPPIVHALLEEGHQVGLSDGHSHEVLQAVQDGSIHVGFVLGGIVPPGLSAIEVARDDIVCVKGKGSSFPSKVNLTSLGYEKMVLFPFADDYPKFRGMLAERFGHSLDGVPEISPAQAVRTLLLENGGYYSFLPRKTVEHDVHRGDLGFVEISDLPSFSWRIQLVYKHGVTPHPVMKAIANAMLKAWRTTIQGGGSTCPQLSQFLS